MPPFLLIAGEDSSVWLHELSSHLVDSARKKFGDDRRATAFQLTDADVPKIKDALIVIAQLSGLGVEASAPTAVAPAPSISSTPLSTNATSPHAVQSRSPPAAPLSTTLPVTGETDTELLSVTPLYPGSCDGKEDVLSIFDTPRQNQTS